MRVIFGGMQEVCRKSDRHSPLSVPQMPQKLFPKRKSGWDIRTEGTLKPPSPSRKGRSRSGEENGQRHNAGNPQGGRRSRGLRAWRELFPRGV